MSKSNDSVSVERMHFELGYRLHFGAVNLLLTSTDQLKQAGVLTKSDEQRIERFVQFIASVLHRSASRFYPELVKDESLSEDK